MSMFTYFTNVQSCVIAMRPGAWRILAVVFITAAGNCGTASQNAMNPPTDGAPMADQNKQNDSAKYVARVANGTLRITGTGAQNTRLALRLKAGDPTIIEVDEDNNGSADFSFDRAQFDHIIVKGGAGDDDIRIDEA